MIHSYNPEPMQMMACLRCGIYVGSVLCRSSRLNGGIRHLVTVLVSSFWRQHHDAAGSRDQLDQLDQLDWIGSEMFAKTALLEDRNDQVCGSIGAGWLLEHDEHVETGFSTRLTFVACCHHVSQMGTLTEFLSADWAD